MTVKIRIEEVKPYKVVHPELDGKKLAVGFAIKLYDSKTAEEVQDEFKALLRNEKLEQANALIMQWESTGDKTEDSFYERRKELREAAETIAKDNDEAVLKFYRSQIMFMLNVPVSIKDNDGNWKDSTVEDTRKAAPNESQWATPEECLVVLLDAYFDVPALRDSLTSKIVEVLYGSYSEGKGKNSK